MVSDPSEWCGGNAFFILMPGVNFLNKYHLLTIMLFQAEKLDRYAAFERPL